MNTLLNYATQASTWRGVVNLAVALGVLHMTPAAQDQIVAFALQIVAGGQALIGLINCFHNERKSANLPPISPTKETPQ